MRNSHILFLVLLTGFAGCGLLQKDEERVPIAKAQDHQLYLDELAAALPAGLSTDDSTLFAESFIRQWATHRLLLDRAELNLSEQQKDVSKQLDEYRSSLIIYLYQTEWVRQQMDTTVSDDEILTYYEENKGNFDLQEDIVRVLFVRFDSHVEHASNMRKWMKSDDEEIRALLEDFALQHATAMHLNGQQWIPLAGLLEQLPKNAQVDGNYFRYRDFAEFQDSTSRYFVHVKELKAKNSPAPMEYVRDNIMDIILNRRKLELVKNMEKDIFNEAVAKNRFKML